MEGQQRDPRLCNRIFHYLAHELKNDLNMVSLNTLLLQEARNSARDRALLDATVSAIPDLDNLVDLVVRVSDWQAAAIPTDSRPIAAIAVLRQAADALERSLPDRHVSCPPEEPNAQLRLWVEPDPLAWALAALGLWGVDRGKSDEPLQLGLGRRGSSTVLTVGGPRLRELPDPELLSGPAPGEAALTRANLALALAREMISTLGGSLDSEPPDAPTAWIVAFDAPP